MTELLKRVLCVLMTLTVVFSFSACRQSPVLEQTIYTQDAEVDPENQQTDNDIEHTKQNTTLPPRTTQQTASRQSEQTKVSAKPRTTTANQRNNNSQNNSNSNSNTNSNSRTGINTNSQTGQQGQNPTGGKPSNSDNSNKAQGDTPNVNPNPDSPIPAVDDRSDFDPDKLPENVATVAAVGPAAPFVELLGGQNRLVATSADFKMNTLASAVDDNFSNIEVIAEGNGSNQITDTQFELLLLKNPEAVFYVSKEGYGHFTFSEDQLLTLIEHKIYAIPLNPFNTVENIAENVSVMGSVLGVRDDIADSKDANKMAEKYNDYLKKVAKGFGHTFSGPNKWNLDQDSAFGDNSETIDSYEDSGQYTILIDGWDDTVSTKREQGLAYARTGYSQRHTPASFFLSLGGVANTAVLVPDNSATIKYFPVVPTYMDLTNGPHINGTSLKRSWDYSNTVTGFKNNYIGDASFNKIIVDSSDTYNRIVGSLNAGYAWASTERVTDSSGTTKYGYINESGSIVDSNIHGDNYDIIVNPYGVSSWIDGSPEAPLEAYWANELFNNGNSSSDAFRAIWSEVREFYSTFYNYDLSDSDLAIIEQGI